MSFGLFWLTFRPLVDPIASGLELLPLRPKRRKRWRSTSWAPEMINEDCVIKIGFGFSVQIQFFVYFHGIASDFPHVFSKIRKNWLNSWLRILIKTTQLRLSNSAYKTVEKILKIQVENWIKKKRGEKVGENLCFYCKIEMTQKFREITTFSKTLLLFEISFKSRNAKFTRGIATCRTRKYIETVSKSYFVNLTTFLRIVKILRILQNFREVTTCCKQNFVISQELLAN